MDISNGNDLNSGTSSHSPWKTVAKVNTVDFQPGDQIFFRRGEFWNEELIMKSSGNMNNPIIINAYGEGQNPVIYRITVYSDFLRFQNLSIDHKNDSGDAFRIRGGENCHLYNMEIKNGASDGIDAAGADGLLIDGCHIHHFLAGSFSNQADAHGISVENTKGVVVRNTEIHHVSGDSFQSDPNREGSNDILIENCYLWTGPLLSDFNDWKVGESPGENALDTKVASENWENAERMNITIRNVTAHGWTNNNYIANRAAFNMKEKIAAVFDRITVYDCEIAFRLRGTRGNANTSIQNAVIFNCERAVRAEDDLANLILYNNTFGDYIQTHIQYAGGSGGTGGWDVKNNCFFDIKPTVALHESNRIANSNDFEGSFSGDYHLVSTSSLIDVGLKLVNVTHDRDNTLRPQGANYDIGAYEFVPAVSVEQIPFSGCYTDNTVVLSWHCSDDQNILGFEIERANRQKNWVKIGVVEYSNKNISPNYYHFIDKLSDIVQETKLWYRLKTVKIDGSSLYVHSISVQLDNQCDQFIQNFPNPFNESSMIEFKLPLTIFNNKQNTVDLSIYNQHGKLVKTLINKYLNTGRYKIVWDCFDNNGQKVPSGTYFCILKGNNQIISSKKLTLIK